MILFFKPNSNFIIPIEDDILVVRSLKDFIERNAESTSYDCSSTRDAYSSLVENNPIFTRWQSDLTTFNITIPILAFEISRIVKYLKDKNVKVVIFSSAIAHHIESTVFAIACKIACVKQLFLYCNIAGGGIIPILHEYDIFSRRVINHGMGDFCENQIRFDDFCNRFKENLPPKINTVVTNRRKSYLLGTILLLKILLIKFLVTCKNITKPVCLWEEKWSGLAEIRCMLRQRTALSFYQKHVQTLDLQPNFNVIIAAHFQPEATSFPEGGNFFNHGFIVDEIYHKCGSNMRIAYKEHPTSVMVYENIHRLTRVGNQRSKEYYQSLIHRGVTFVDSSENLIDMVKKDGVFPVTITGSLVLELCLQGYRVVIAGEPWYKDIPGSIHLKDLDNIDLSSMKNLKSEIISREAKSWIKHKILPNQLENPLGISDLRYGDKQKFSRQIIEICRNIEFYD